MKIEYHFIAEEKHNKVDWPISPLAITKLTGLIVEGMAWARRDNDQLFNLTINFEVPHE